MAISDDEKIKISYLRYWLIDHCQKWIISFSKPNIYVILSENMYNTIDKTKRSFKSYIISHYMKNNNDDIKIYKDWIKMKTIDSDEKLILMLKNYFIKSNNVDDIKFDNMEMKGYTNNYIITLLQNNNLKTSSNIKNNQEIDPIINNYGKFCYFCSKEFNKNFNKKRHEKICKKNKTINSNDIETIIENKVKTTINDNMDAFIEKLSNKINNECFNNTINNNTINSNINIQINNNNKYISKKDKLNHYLKNMIDLDTFTNNYKNDPKYHLTKDESLILLENSENLGLPSYGDGLYTYLKKKYCLQLEDLTGLKQKHNDSVLPFISNDTNLRSHYELTKNGWILIKSTDNIKKLLNISDEQIYKHHNKFIYYPTKKGKNTIVNIFLRKSDYSKIDSELENISNTLNKQIEN